MLDDEKLKNLDIPIQQEVNALAWLRAVAPAFPVNGSKVESCVQCHCVYFALTRMKVHVMFQQITIIYKPEMFYTTLLEKCRHAKRRITFASLYLGTGVLEVELVGTTRKNAKYFII